MTIAGTQGRTLFKGGTVLSLDPAVGDHARADVLVDGTRSAAVGPDNPSSRSRTPTDSSE